MNEIRNLFMAPVAKLLQIGIAPVAEAGLLYVGAGAGMLIIYLIQNVLGVRQDRPSIGREDLRYVIAMIILACVCWGFEC